LFKSTSPNICLAKVWQEVGTSTAVRYQIGFWGLTSSKNLFGNLIITFLIGIGAGLTSFKFQTLAKQYPALRLPALTSYSFEYFGAFVANFFQRS